ncbi:MAG: adenylyl-sulfate kinase [archaeon]
MKTGKSHKLKYPTIPAFSMSKYYHPKVVKLPSAKKPVSGKILIFRGPSGSGKTTKAQLLEKKFKGKIKVFHFGFERRKRHLGFSVGDKVLLISKLQSKIDSALKKYKVVILDELFDFEEQLWAVRENHPHARILIIYFELPMEVSIKRASTRRKGKHYTPLKEKHIEGLWYLAHFVKCGKVISADGEVKDVLNKVIVFLKKKGFL